MNSAFRALIGSFYKPKKNDQFDPNTPLSETNQPYQDPSFGMRFWNPDAAQHINSLNEQAMLAPGERAAQMADWQARQGAIQGMQNAEKIKALKERDLVIASVMQNNPEFAKAYASQTTSPAQNAIDLMDGFKIDKPTDFSNQLGAAADIAGGVPALQSQGRGLAAQREIATDKGFFERLPAAKRIQDLTDQYTTMNTEGLIKSLPAVQRYNDVKTAFDTDNTLGMHSELPTTQRLQHINNYNAINQGLYNTPMTQQLERSQTQLGQNEADTRLDNADTAKRTLVNKMGNEEFLSQYDPAITQMLEGSRSLATRGPGGYSLIDNTQFKNPELQKFQDMQAMMTAMQGGGKGAAMGAAYGLPKKAAAPIPVGPRGQAGNTGTPRGIVSGGRSVSVETAPTATAAAEATEAAKKKRDKIRKAYGTLQLEPTPTFGGSTVPISAAVPVMNFLEQPFGIPWRR
jgi:hypothetical protein